MYPKDLRYTKDHEWLRLAGDKGTIGVTDHAQKQLGDVVFLELPEVGRSLAQQAVFGTVESVKAVSELFAPVSGTVAEINSELISAPERINSDPYGVGWMLVMTLTDPKQVDELMDAAAYEAYVSSEAK
jgi:glycine cleavage system H protein